VGWQLGTRAQIQIDGELTQIRYNGTPQNSETTVTADTVNRNGTEGHFSYNDNNKACQCQ